jgi:initiation factor 1A
MPKNIKGGNKAKKGKNSLPQKPKDILYPDKSGFQFYAIVEQYLGHTSNLIMLRETKDEKGNIIQSLDKTLGIIRGKILKKCKPRRGDVLLVSIREFSDKAVDIIHKYTDENIKDLKRDNTFPDNFVKLIDAYGSADNKKTLDQLKEADMEHIEFDEHYEPQPEYSLDFESEEEQNSTSEEED